MSLVWPFISMGCCLDLERAKAEPAYSGYLPLVIYLGILLLRVSSRLVVYDSRVHSEQTKASLHSVSADHAFPSVPH